MKVAIAGGHGKVALHLALAVRKNRGTELNVAPASAQVDRERISGADCVADDLPVGEAVADRGGLARAYVDVERAKVLRHDLPDRLARQPVVANTASASS